MKLYEIILLLIVICILDISITKKLERLEKKIEALSSYKDNKQNQLTDTINIKSFPNWQVADSTVGKEARYTDLWCEVATE